MLAFNDYPAREYASSEAEVHGPRWGEDIVCSALKDAAAERRSQCSELRRTSSPPYVGDDYVGASHPTTWRNLKNSLETIHQYTETGLAHIFNGEIGRYESTRFIEQTFIPKGGAANATVYDPFSGTPQPWTNGQSSWGIFAGGDTVTEAVCIPEEIRAKIPGDFGRSRGLAWYYLGGFGLVHNDPLNARIVFWDSST